MNGLKRIERGHYADERHDFVVYQANTVGWNYRLQCPRIERDWVLVKGDRVTRGFGSMRAAVETGRSA